MVDRRSPYVSKNAKDFLELLAALRRKQNNSTIRGGVICRESAHHRKEKVAPFARSTQDYLLENGVILLSIPDTLSEDDADSAAAANASEEHDHPHSNDADQEPTMMTTTTIKNNDDAKTTATSKKISGSSDMTMATPNEPSSGKDDPTLVKHDQQKKNADAN